MGCARAGVPRLYTRVFPFNANWIQRTIDANDVEPTVPAELTTATSAGQTFLHLKYGLMTALLAIAKCHFA